MSRRYKAGTARNEQALLPACIEDYVGANNVVRAIDTYVDSLNLKALGFRHASGGRTAGQPSFHPGAMLKLYLFSYLNRVSSSRRIAHECQRNLEFIWLLEGLRPSYRCIADFRATHGEALQASCKDFVLLCKKLELLGGELVAIDGAFFNGNASDKSILSKRQIEKELEQIAAQVGAYHQALEVQDQAEQDQPEAQSRGEVEALGAKLEQIKAHQAKREAQLKTLEACDQTQLSRTDPDARMLSKSGQRVVGYNVQNVIDAKHKLIVHHEVTNAGNDAEQLSTQAKSAKEILQVQALEAVADGGYYSEQELAACQAAQITAYVPPCAEHVAPEDGRLSCAEFRYDPVQNAYVCPAGALLLPRKAKAAHEDKHNKPDELSRTGYSTRKAVCAACALKDRCLPPSGKRLIWRSEHAELIAQHRLRMEHEGAERMKTRASLAEHPFGTLKTWFGWRHFLLRGFQKVRGEMSLMVLAYNLRRVINILGQDAFQAHFLRPHTQPGMAQ